MSPWLRRFTKLVAASTLFLVFAGAMVTSTGSGLAVPDWPLSYGMLMPPMVGGIFYEHGHRMIAATVGFLTVVQAIWIQLRDPRRFVRRLAWTSVGAVIVQGVLGGLTVIFLLPDAISVSHAALAEIFLCLNVAIAFYCARRVQSTGHPEEWSDEGSQNARPSHSEILRFAQDDRKRAYAIVAALFIQVLLGALMRHREAGLAIPDFPLSFGRIIPEFTSSAIAINFAHRAWAVVVAVLILALAPRAMRSAGRSAYAILLTALGVQIVLGAFTVWTAKHPMVTSVHVMTGALMLATSVVFALMIRSARRDEDKPALALREVTA